MGDIIDNLTGKVIDEGSVTGTRYNARDLSHSCNAVIGRGKGERESIDANSCHSCRVAFMPGQLRYPVMDGVACASQGWGLVSICEECFTGAWWYPKYGYQPPGTHLGDSSYVTLDRFQKACRGCGQPMMTNTGYKAFKWCVCSIRCYQRQHRQRNTLKNLRACDACKRLFEPKRDDAKFCSNKCRQWHYRRTRQV